MSEHTHPEREPKFQRAPKATGLAVGEDGPTIDPDGGDFGAGVILGVSLITRGEALGHDAYVDQFFVQQVHDKVGQAGGVGVKSRFTHPGLSADGLGHFLGRLKNPKFVDDGDRVLADLHLAEAARHAPDGDLSAYVLKMAKEDPAAFGTSIVFSRDRGEEARFSAEHQDKDGKFKSPDEKNGKNLRHFRLAALHAGDVVDDPAANPDGLFHRGAELAKTAEAVLDYSLGRSDEMPDETSLDIHPERIKGFLSKYLADNGLSIVNVDELQRNSEASNSQNDEPATLEQLKEACPDADSDFYVGQLEAKATSGKALSAWLSELSKRLSERNEEIEQLQKQLAVNDEAEEHGASFSGDDGDDGDTKKSPLGEKLGRYAANLKFLEPSNN